MAESRALEYEQQPPGEAWNAVEVFKKIRRIWKPGIQEMNFFFLVSWLPDYSFQICRRGVKNPRDGSAEEVSFPWYLRDGDGLDRGGAA